MSTTNDFHKMPEGFDLGQAIAEADRCLLCHDAPCSKGCPANTKPAEFIRKFRLRNITGAIRTIKENNILGGACAEYNITSGQPGSGRSTNPAGALAQPGLLLLAGEGRCLGLDLQCSCVVLGDLGLELRLLPGLYALGHGGPGQ